MVCTGCYEVIVVLTLSALHLPEFSVGVSEVPESEEREEGW